MLKHTDLVFYVCFFLYMCVQERGKDRLWRNICQTGPPNEPKILKNGVPVGGPRVWTPGTSYGVPQRTPNGSKMSPKTIGNPLVLKRFSDVSKTTSFMQWFCLLKNHLFYAVEHQILLPNTTNMTSQGRKGEPHSCQSKRKTEHVLSTALF